MAQLNLKPGFGGTKKPKISLKGKPVLCIEFDGVIHSNTSRWPDGRYVADPPVEGAFEFIYEASKDFEVYIFGTRSQNPVAKNAMMAWVGFWLAQKLTIKQMQELDGKINFPDHKPLAAVYIQPNTVTFEGNFPRRDELLQIAQRGLN